MTRETAETTERSWTTQDELKFIKDIGTHSEKSLCSRSLRARKAELLEKYLESADMRTDWVDINKSRVISYARKLLRPLRPKSRE